MKNQSQKEITMKRKFSRLILAAGGFALFASLFVPAQAADEAQERAELAKALTGAKGTLHSGLQTSA
jgi:hypothetical protein